MHINVNNQIEIEIGFLINIIQTMVIQLIKMFPFKHRTQSNLNNGVNATKTSKIKQNLHD